VDDEFASDFMGAITGTEGLRVTHVLYADDLTLTATNDPVLSDQITVTAKYKTQHIYWFPPNLRGLWNKPGRLREKCAEDDVVQYDIMKSGVSTHLLQWCRELIT